MYAAHVHIHIHIPTYIYTYTHWRVALKFSVLTCTPHMYVCMYIYVCMLKFSVLTCTPHMCPVLTCTPHMCLAPSRAPRAPLARCQQPQTLGSGWLALTLNLTTDNQNTVQRRALLSATAVGGSVFLLSAGSTDIRFKQVKADLAACQQSFRAYSQKRRVEDAA